jgi:methionyl-tRNA formyltransferase
MLDHPMSEFQPQPIVFFGTPLFAARCLEVLHQGGVRISGVVTAPDRPAGRGRKLNESPVKRYALEHGLPLAQPERLKSPDFLAQLRIWNPALQVIVAFRMLPEVVWNSPPLGTINLHASLLPAYRGAAPIQWAIINGETQTGLTTFRLRHEIDTGDMIGKRAVNIDPEADAGALHDLLLEVGAPLLLEGVQQVLNGTAVFETQIADLQTEYLHAPKLRPETGRIDWNMGAQKIHNLVRGLSPSPGAHTLYRSEQMKILRTRRVVGPLNLLAGQTTNIDGNWLVGCGDGLLVIEQVQAAGARPMSAQEFLRGHPEMKEVIWGT